MNDWLFPRIVAGNDGVANLDPTVDAICVVWHTTEIPHVRITDPWVSSWGSPSHILADPYRREVGQCVSLSRAGKSLWNEAGGVQTNLRETVWQVEIHMLSPNGSMERPDLSDDDYRWLAETVLVPLYKESVVRGCPIDLDDTPDPGVIPNSARDDAPQRFSHERWNSFRGNCGHRHVPENDHWDVGSLNLKKLVAYAKEALTPPPPVGEDPEMPSYLVFGTNQVVWAVYPSGTVRQLGSGEFAFLSNLTPAIPQVSSSGVNEDALMVTYAAR